jgi:hypothetical protein
MNSPDSTEGKVTPAIDGWTTERVKEELRAQVKLLLEAPAVELVSIALRVQRLRIALSLLNELDGEGVLSDAAYKELVLLTRMISKGPDAEPSSPLEPVLTTAGPAEEDPLEKAGIDKADANRLAGVFERLITKDPDERGQPVPPPIPEDYEPDDTAVPAA